MEKVRVTKRMEATARVNLNRVKQCLHFSVICNNFTCIRFMKDISIVLVTVENVKKEEPTKKTRVATQIFKYGM